MDEEVLNPLLLRVASGDREAMGVLFLRVRRPLLQFLWRLCRCREMTDDLLQGTCLRLWNYRGSFRGQNARAYLYRVALNEWRSRWAKEQRRADATLAASEVISMREPLPPEHEAHTGDLRRRVRAAVDTLPEAQREAFVLHRFEGMSCREIGELLGESRKTIESRLRLALQKLTGKLRHLEKHL